MPIVVDADVRLIDQPTFGALAYRGMDCVFALHDELGRFFAESVYRDAIPTSTTS
jgi:hypothetical protein